MTENRFTIDEDGNITDTINDRCLYVENRMTECNYFVKLLNEQYEELMTCHSYLSSKINVENENAELRKENEQLYELLDFANTLFAFKTSESCQKEWEKKLNELIVND